MQELLAALSLILMLATGTVQTGIDIDQTYGASYTKTTEIAAFSRHVIETYRTDLSELKVACFGDSLTSGVGQGLIFVLQCRIGILHLIATVGGPIGGLRH